MSLPLLPALIIQPGIQPATLPTGAEQQTEADKDEEKKTSLSSSLPLNIPRYRFVKETTIGTQIVNETQDVPKLNQLIDQQLDILSNLQRNGGAFRENDDPTKTTVPQLESLICFLSDHGFIDRRVSIEDEIKRVCNESLRELRELFCGAIPKTIRRPGMTDEDEVLLLPDLVRSSTRSKLREQRILEYLLQRNSSRYQCNRQRHSG